MRTVTPGDPLCAGLQPLSLPELCSIIKKYAKLGIWILQTDEELCEAVGYGADMIETTGGVKPRKI